MPRCEFGTPDKVSGDATAAMAKLSPQLKRVFTSVGLHSISALDPCEGLVMAIVNVLGIQTEEEFLYIEPDFPEEAAGDEASYAACYAASQPCRIAQDFFWSSDELSQSSQCFIV